MIKLNHWYRKKIDYNISYIYYFKINDKLLFIYLSFDPFNDLWKANLHPNFNSDNNYIKLEIYKWKYPEIKYAKKNAIDLVKLNLKQNKNG